VSVGDLPHAAFRQAMEATMKKSVLIILLPFIFWGIATVHPPPATASDSITHVVLIGWDGVQREHLKESMARNELPHLAALVSEGALMAIDITTGATDTKAGWAQILTGYAPSKTGVYSNRDYRPIPRGYTILERFEDRFGKDEAVTVFLTGNKGNLGARGPHYHVPDQKKAQKGAAVPAAGPSGDSQPERNVSLMEGEPYFLTSRHVHIFENGLGRSDQVGARALELMDIYRKWRFFFFIHFGEPDQQGHKYGENSREYTEGIIRDDQWLGRIIAKLKDLGLYDRTRIYVVSDHGFDEGERTHKRASQVFLATNDSELGLKGDRMDVAPTILWRLGFDLPSTQPPLDGKPLKRGTPGQAIW
jgi:hypothetical protein